MMKIDFTLPRIALFFIGACVAVYSYADETSSQPPAQSESKQIICKTSEEVKRLCSESLQTPSFFPLDIPKKALLLDYSNNAISSLQNRLLSVRKHISNPTFRLNVQNDNPVLGMGLINQEILRISFLLGTDINIEQATAEELMNSLTQLELKPNIGFGFERYW